MRKRMNRGETFYFSYSLIERYLIQEDETQRDGLILGRERTFSNKIIKILHDSFKGIQDGNYKEVCDRIEAASLPKDSREMVYLTLNLYLKAFHAAIPRDLIKDKDDLKNIETDRRKLKRLTEIFDDLKDIEMIIQKDEKKLEELTKSFV